ncbi:PEP-CTERM sorting domain-containing protein [Ruficoccus amylovorans]|uniref:PEP-CTERM sorting domain-containing protein n=1 Tax=Ruficoccus amylovorans TaxID=1804625 RepID=A0A842HAF3_9BACT|nr:PEP-CTERM sorting domain-containing protein [Ruficoccus amylovorans]MBC2593109.1 PEP-CTERM sorting domain-containing protein [Ruficoccus amylovorans]
MRLKYGVCAGFSFSRQCRSAVALLALMGAGSGLTSSAWAQATLKIVNNFNPSVNNAADYFGGGYNDSEVWLYFLNTGGAVSYTDTTSGMTTSVSNATSIKLSDVQNGTFSLDVGSVSTKVFAGLGASNPFSGTNGPGVFDQNVPYALAEWTINGNSNDNIDVSYEDTFAFPTTLKVKNSDGTKTAGFKAGTQAADVISLLSSRMPTTPTGPNNANYPSPGGVGYGPLVPTVSGNPAANRWIGSSKTWTSGPGASTQVGGETKELRSMYTYAPSMENYLQHLRDNEPTTSTASGDKQGWYIDYSGNNGYSGFMQVKEDGSIEINNIRVNTEPSAANDWEADPDAGDATTGTITIVANGTVVPSEEGDGSYVNGQWTDGTLYSGASLVNGDFASGPIIIATGDFAEGGTHHDIVATMIASLSASIATGLLGSDMYNESYHTDELNAAVRYSTMYWFNELLREDAMTKLFGAAWPEGDEFYDPYWATLAELTDMEGYLSPFNDRWANFSPDFNLEDGSEITWELGLLNVPEPATYAQILAVLTLGLAFIIRRRRNRG